MTETGFPGKYGMIGTSQQMLEVYHIIERFAPVDVPILIVGETGTGKELVARAIHENSNRTGRYEVINCAATTKQLLLSEFFGHMKGAFTGAYEDRSGLFEIAHKGTVFLDELTETGMELQTALLRYSEYGCFKRIGGEKERTSDVRLITSTNRDPYQAIMDGVLRNDLYYRLGKIIIDLPPLRDRGADISLLTKHFLKGKNLDNEGMMILRKHDWPGNVRQLQNVIHYASLVSEGDTIDNQVLKERIAQDESLQRKKQAYALREYPEGLEAAVEAVKNLISCSRDLSLKEQLNMYRVLWWEDLYNICGGDKKKMAEEARVDVKTVERILREYPLER